MGSPFFSVVVPTYARPAQVQRLLALLDRQTLRTFEVIVVDQSSPPTAIDASANPLQVTHHHVTERGATRARNIGIGLARGEVVAFIDDDCEPDPLWLHNAAKYFQRPANVGIEGRVECDQTDVTRFRIVTNRGLEGLGFLTANLMIRRDALASLGGFDERFDDPHFREDTDLGWRALQIGQIPFAEDVRVVHPAAAPEPWAKRRAFFLHDALLFHKHADRYVQLARLEGHHRRRGYWRAFMEGIVLHSVPIDMTKLTSLMPSADHRFCVELCSVLGFEGSP